MSFINNMKNKVISGYKITKEEALLLHDSPLDDLLSSANEIRETLCKDSFDICTIINGKSGGCSEDCKYCAQSSHYHTCVDEYPLLGKNEIQNCAISNYQDGVLRFSIVTSGRSLDEGEMLDVCDAYRSIQENCPISLCASHGLLTYEQFIKLRQAGVIRYHCNLETSRRFFPDICSTHTYDDKINTIRNAQLAGLEVCSGGIIGLGEDVEDRIDMVMDLRELGIKSIPVNILNPIKGTPLEHRKVMSNEDVLRTIAVFRFIIPKGAIRLAGGRGLLADKGMKAFMSGANAAISGNMLTTIGININEDLDIIKKCGYRLQIL